MPYNLHTSSGYRWLSVGDKLVGMQKDPFHKYNEVIYAKLYKPSFNYNENPKYNPSKLIKIFNENVAAEIMSFLWPNNWLLQAFLELDELVVS